MPALRIVFMGTPDLACASLEALLARPGFQIVGVVTQPDRPKGRELRLQPPPVKEFALGSHLQVLQPERARNEDFISELRRLAPELIVVAAYGQILPKAILDLPRFGCINVHTSLLPKYRGAAPIQWAILNGDAVTGVTIMKMDVGMDTGDILTAENTAIGDEDNGETLHDRLAGLGASLLVKTIPEYVAGSIQPRPQPGEGASYAPKIKKEHGLIDWRQPARTIWNRVRGLVPWPGAFTHLPNRAQMLKVWAAGVMEGAGQPGVILEADKHGIAVGCGQGVLILHELQREGGRRLTAEQFLAGHPLKPGQRLGRHMDTP